MHMQPLLVRYSSAHVLLVRNQNLHSNLQLMLQLCPDLLSCMWDTAVVLISWMIEAQVRQLVAGLQPILHDTALFYFYVITFQKKILPPMETTIQTKEEKLKKGRKWWIKRDKCTDAFLLKCKNRESRLSLRSLRPKKRYGRWQKMAAQWRSTGLAERKSCC